MVEEEQKISEAQKFCKFFSKLYTCIQVKLVQVSLLSPSCERNTRKKDKGLTGIERREREERGKEIISPGSNVDLANRVSRVLGVTAQALWGGLFMDKFSLSQV